MCVSCCSSQMFFFISIDGIIKGVLVHSKRTDEKNMKVDYQVFNIGSGVNAPTKPYFYRYGHMNDPRLSRRGVARNKIARHAFQNL